MQVIVTANTRQANAALAGVQKQLGSTAAASRTVGSRMATAGKAGAAGLAALGIASTAVAIDFDRAMRNVNSIAQLPEKQLAKLSEEVRGLAGKTAQSPQTLAEGLYDLVSSGFDARESMTVLRSSANAATAGLTDTATSTKAVAAALNAYRMPASKADKVSDIMFRTVDRGVISFETLAGSIGNAMPASAALGVRLDALGAAVATLTKQGQSGETAIVNINAAMTSLFKPTTAMEGALKELGYKNAEALIAAEGLQGGLQSLVETTDGTTASVGELFANVRAQRAVFGLTGKNAADAASDLRGLEDASGATSRALSQQSQSVSFMWNKLKAQAADLAIGIGNNVLPVLKDLMQTISSDKLSTEEKVSKIMESIEKAIKEHGPRVAEAAGRIGLQIIRGIASTFMQSDVLGKLFIGAAALRLFGGPGVFMALGGTMAKWLFAGFGTAAAAGGAAGAGAGAAGGAAAGGILSGLRTLIPRAGIIGLGAIAGDQLIRGINDGIARGSGSVQEAIGAAIPDKFSGPGMIEGIFGLSDETRQAKHLMDTTTHILRDKIGISEETKEQMLAQGRLIGLNEEQMKQLERIAGYGETRLRQSEQLSEMFRGMKFNLTGRDLLPQATLDEVQARLEQMRRGMFTSQGQIASVMKQNKENILSLNLPSKKTGKMLGENMRAGARAMQKALKDGSIKGVKNIREARQKIRHLLRAADLTEGIRPRDFGDQFAKAIKAGQGATKEGIDKIVKDLHRMPKDARNAAFQTMMAQLREYRKGGQLSDKEFKNIRAKLLVRLKGITGDGKKQSGLLKDIMGGNFFDLAGSIFKGLQNIGSNVSKVLSSFDVDWRKFTLAAPSGGGGGGGHKKRQQGGLVPGIRAGALVPGQGSGDKVPLHIAGRLAALVEPGELVSVANRTVTGQLMAANKAVPRRQDGGIVSHLAKGGVASDLAFALGPYTIPPIQYDANHAGGNSHWHISANSDGPWIRGIGKALQRMGFTVGEHPAFGGVQAGHSRYGASDHYHGGAIDVNSAADETRSETAQVARLISSGKISGAVAGMVEKIAREVLKGPKGAILTAGQNALDDAWNAANKYIAENMPTDKVVGITSGGAVPAQMGRYLLANKFSRAGAAGIIGNAYRESLWDPGAVGTGGGGLFGFTTSPVSLADMQAYAKRKGRPWTDVETQMEFMLSSPGGGGLVTDSHYNSLESFLKSTGNVHEATMRFMTEWERPGIPAFEDRLAGAQRAFQMKSWQRGGVIGKLKRGGLIDLNIGKAINRLLSPGPQKGKPAEKYDDAEHDKDITSAIRNRIRKLTKNDKFPTKDGSLQGKLAELRGLADQYGEWAGYSEQLGKPFRGKDQKGWLTEQLSTLLRLRNALIKSEKMVERMQRQVRKALIDASKRQKKFERRARQGQKALDKEGKTPKDWKGDDPRKVDVKKWNQLGGKRKELMRKFLREGGKLPGDRLFSRNGALLTPESHPNAFPNVEGWKQVAGFLKNTVIQGLKGGDGTSGAINDALRTLGDEIATVQGTGLPHNIRRNLPPFGTLGGEIFDVQSLLNEGGEARTFAIDELRSVIEAARYGVFDYADTFHTGGIVPGSGEVPIVAQGGEGVFTPEQMQAMGKGATEIHIENHFDWQGMDLWVETKINGEIAKREKIDHHRGRQFAR